MKAWTDALAQAKTNSPLQSVTAKPGDTLASIANSHRATVQDLETANPLTANPNGVYIGRRSISPRPPRLR